MHTKDFAWQLGYPRTSKQPGASCYCVAFNQLSVSTSLHTKRKDATALTSTLNSMRESAASAIPTVISAHHSQRFSSHIRQCQSCFHMVSLTSAGVLYKHGPKCPGSGQPLRAADASDKTSAQTQAQHSTDDAQPSSVAPSTDTTISLTSAGNRLQAINDVRCQVLRQIPKASNTCGQ